MFDTFDTFETTDQRRTRMEEEQKRIEEEQEKNSLERKESIKKCMKIFIQGFILAIIIGIIIGAITIIPAGHRGVRTTFGKINNEILGEGFHFKWPIADTIHKLSVRIEKYEVSAPASSKDLQNVDTQIALNFHLNPLKVQEIYQNIGDLETLGVKLITPIVQEAVKASTANYTAEELITKRPTTRDLMKEYVDKRLNYYGIIVDDFSIINFHFSNTFNAAIEAKVTAEQNYLKAQRDLERVKVEASQKVETAKAEAESLKMQKQEITTDLIELRKIEVQKAAIDKWNGALPQYTGSGAIPFINITK